MGFFFLREITREFFSLQLYKEIALIHAGEFSNTKENI